MKPDPEELRELGENVTNVQSAWAGAPDYLSRGLKAWARTTVGKDRNVAVAAALSVCELVANSYSADQQGLPPKSYIEHMLASIRRWLDDPSRENTERVRSSLDVTRSAHAWQREQDVAPFWILDAVDHASLAVWSGERASYIVPMDYGTCAARSITCVLHAMLDLGTDEGQAIDSITTAVAGATRRRSSPAIGQ
jgi:hypothetical protein